MTNDSIRSQLPTRPTARQYGNDLERTAALMRDDSIHDFAEESTGFLHFTKACEPDAGWHMWPEGRISGACECGAFDPFIDGVTDTQPLEAVYGHD